MDIFSSGGIANLQVDGELITWLKERIGNQYALNRLGKENRHEAKMLRRGRRLRLRTHGIIDVTVPLVLRFSGLLRSGRTNATRIDVARNRVALPFLPGPFVGFKILHLSDLHADISEGAMRAIPQAISKLEYDICVITGDFRGKTYGPYEKSMIYVREIMRGIVTPTYGVLGNHDTVMMLRDLEQTGIQMLMNESTLLRRGSARLRIAGVDDPHFYKTADLRAALTNAARNDAVVLLAHSADVYQEAEDQGVGLLLCGHTHGGQICLPGGIPLLTQSNVGRRFVSGPWRHHRLIGYTSRGVGTSAIDARFNCVPEVAIHTLDRL